MELYKHNRKIYEALCEMLERTDRACVIEPPGCGKSFVAYKLVEDNPDKKFLWLAPNDYVFAEQRANFEREGSPLLPNMETMTYATAMLRSRGGDLDIKADYIILDEFHHCGAPEWSRGVQAVIDQCPTAKIVGISATEVRYSDNERDMSKELFYGNVACKMTFEEAWVRGILPFPKYICALYDSPSELGNILMEVNAVRDEQKHSALMNRYEKLRRAIEQADGIDVVFKKHLEKKDSKVIVFCPNVEQMKVFYTLRRDWFKQVNSNIHAYLTYSSNPYGERDYEAFKEDNSSALKLLYCVNQLNEGVHISGINAVVMVRPTKSPVVYKQQLGRALDIGNDNEPIVFDLVNNIGSVGNVIAYKNDLQREFERLLNEGEEGLFDPKDFVIIDEVRDVRFLMHEMMEAAAPDLLSIAERRPEIIGEWDYERNGQNTPYTVSTRSTDQYWWRCGRCGESYQESPLHRTWLKRKRHDCPFCSDRPTLLQEYPEAATFWSADVNGIEAADVILTDKALEQVAHWHCERGHEWESAIGAQIKQDTCTQCSSEIRRKRKRLSRCRPLVNEWDQELNNCEPGVFFNDSKCRVWWKCGRGHRWKDRIYNRYFLKAGCPFCSGVLKHPGDESLAKQHPEFSSQLNLDKERLTPDEIHANRAGSLSWVCPVCHEGWDATIDERASDPTCPYCSDRRLKQKYNDLETVLPELAKEWASIGRKPSEVLYTEETEPLNWKCSNCGGRFKATLQSRVKHYRKHCAVVDCPQCHGSRPKIAYTNPEHSWLVAGQKVEHARYGIGIIETIDKTRHIVFIRFDVGLRGVALRDEAGQRVLKPISMRLDDIR